MVVESKRANGLMLTGWQTVSAPKFIAWPKCPITKRAGTPSSLSVSLHSSRCVYVSVHARNVVVNRIPCSTYRLLQWNIAKHRNIAKLTYFFCVFESDAGKNFPTMTSRTYTRAHCRRQSRVLHEHFAVAAAASSITHQCDQLYATPRLICLCVRVKIVIFPLTTKQRTITIRRAEVILH